MSAGARCANRPSSKQQLAAPPFRAARGVNAAGGASVGGLPRNISQPPSAPAMPGLEEELRGMKLGALSKRARQAGVTAEQLEDAQDEDEPKTAVINLILAKEDPTIAIRTELRKLKLGALSRRAREAGVGPDDIEDAQDADVPKEAVIELIISTGIEMASSVLQMSNESLRASNNSLSLSPRPDAPGTPREAWVPAPAPAASPLARASTSPAAAAAGTPPAPAPAPAPAPGGAAEAFAALDADGDGVVTAAEFAASFPEPAAEPVAEPAPAEPEPAPAGPDLIQLWIKTAKGTISVTADSGPATSVGQIRAKIAAETDVDAASCRLIFAGKELEDSLTLADYSCNNASELNLILRASVLDAQVEADSSADHEAEEATAALRQMMEGTKLRDFSGFKKIGGKDITALGGGGYSQSGVCSYVYLAQMRNGNGMQLALKVMLNYEDSVADTLAIGEEFDAETALLSDPVRLPPHRHVMAVLHSFTDTVSHLPGWDCKCSRSLCVLFREKFKRKRLRS